MEAVMSLWNHVSCGRCNGSMEEMPMTIEDMKSVVKHVFLADHDLRKTYVVALGDVVCCFIIGKDVRGWKPLSSHSPTFEPLRRGRKNGRRLEEGDVVARNVF